MSIMTSNGIERMSPSAAVPDGFGQHLEFSGRWRSPFSMACKRIVDVLGSTLLLFLLSPVFVGLAIAIWLSSPGPVLYRWKVVGKEGRPFVGHKFRSMYRDADQLKSTLEHFNEMTGPVFKLTNDPRVTPFGHWMRRYSLDELPQLFSVLKGEMSLVGPRPPLVTEYIRFTEFQKQKLAVKPGITCLWQINGRNSVRDFDRWVKLDLEYIRDSSMWLDAKILLKTVRVVFWGTGK